MPFQAAALMFALENTALMAGGYYAARGLFTKSGCGLPAVALVIYLTQITLLQEALGLMGLLRPLPVFTAAVLIGAAEVLAFRNKKADILPGEDAPVYGLAEFLSLALALCSAFLLLRSNLFQPPTDTDSVLYHLPITASMLYHGGMLHIDAPFGFYPANSETLSLWLLMPFRDDFLAGLQNLAPAVLGFLSFYMLARRLKVGADIALITALAAVSMPVVQRQLADQENDVYLAFSVLAGIALLVTFFETRRTRWLAAASLSMGLALGTKYSGMYYLAAFWLIILVWLIRERGVERPVRIFAVSALFALLGGGFWYLRNFFIYGSPVYPLGLGVFGLLKTPDRTNLTLSGMDFIRTTLLYHLGEPAVWRLTIRSLITYAPVASVGIALTPFGIWCMRGRSRNRWAVALWVFLFFLIFLATPLVVENTPGSMNLLEEGYSPARLGLPFVLSACLMLTVSADAMYRRFRHKFFKVILVTAIFFPVWRGMPAHVLLSVVVVSVLLTVVRGRLRLYRRFAAVSSAVTLMLALIIFGQGLMERKNSVRGEVYGERFPYVPPTGLYSFIDRNIHGCAVNCLWYYGVSTYAFWGPSFENPLQTFPEPELLSGEGFTPHGGLPQLFVVTIQTVDGSRPDYLKFPDIDAVFRSRPGRFRLIYQDHFAHVYRLDRNFLDKKGT